MIYFVNPASKRRKSKASAGKRRKKKASPAQMRARKKFAAMAKARAKAAKSKKRASTRRKPIMARKRRAVASKRRRRTVRRKGGAGVRLVRRGTTVYQGNPRRRRRRVRYGRNPGILAQVKQTAKDTAFVLVGGAAGRTISNVIPIGGSPLLDFAKGTVAALAVRMAASKFLGADAARFAAAGAMQVPLKALVTGFVPGASSFLGASDYELAAYSDVAGYIGGTGSTDMLGEDDSDLAAYSDVVG